MSRGVHNALVWGCIFGAPHTHAHPPPIPFREVPLRLFLFGLAQAKRTFVELHKLTSF